MVVNPYFLSISLFLLSFAVVVLINHRRINRKRLKYSVYNEAY